ncbi:MAG: hypothetical protein O3C45_11440, partial [Bacteroidetes bacterium]|nr:hypothetical protein [Bacteroidota bacterium]
MLTGCVAGDEPAAPTWRVAERSEGALPASALVQEWQGLEREERESRAVSEILAGNVPSWLRTVHWLTVDIAGADGSLRVELGVLPDYLAVGSDDDFLWIPLSPQAAQRIADATGMLLPTPFLVDAIWR